MDLIDPATVGRRASPSLLCRRLQLKTFEGMPCLVVGIDEFFSLAPLFFCEHCQLYGSKLKHPSRTFFVHVSKGQRVLGLPSLDSQPNAFDPFVQVISVWQPADSDSSGVVQSKSFWDQTMVDGFCLGSSDVFLL